MVSRTIDLIHSLWTKVQLEAPPLLQRTVVQRLHQAKEIARLLARPALPVYQLRGREPWGPLTVTWVGLDFARPALQNLLFAGDTVEQQIGHVPFWRYNELVKRPSSDIIIVAATQHLIRKLPRDNAIVLPEYVRHILDVRGDWNDVRKRFHKSVRKNELRWIRKYGYRYDISRDRQHFAEFYQRMYLPTMKARHGERSSPMSAGVAYQYFRHGWLFQVTRNGDWVSGMICHPQQDVLVTNILGIKEADARLMHEGATSATCYAAIHWANQHGYSAVNFLGTDPYINTGSFQHKRKWGTSVRVPPHLYRQIWIRVQRHTPAVSQFLTANPFVVVDDDGKLHGLIIADAPQNASAETRQMWAKRYATPGLNSLLVRSTGHYARRPTAVDDADVIIQIPTKSLYGDGQYGIGDHSL